MSDRTKAALDTALAAHIADVGDGHLLTGYALIAVGVNGSNLERDSAEYFTEYADGQPFHSSLGLALMLRTTTETWENGDDDGQ